MRALFILMAVSLTAGIAHASQTSGDRLNTEVMAGTQQVMGVLNLSATINNQPALKPVTWTVSIRRSVGNQLVHIDRKHLTTLRLLPGNYEVVLKIANQQETRSVTIMEESRHDLVIDMR